MWRKLILAMPRGTFIFPQYPVYGWYLAAIAIGVYMSWSLHNVIAWMKSRPFLSRRVSLFYIGTVILVQPYWVLEVYANFAYFNDINDVFLKTRPLEPLFRYVFVFPAHHSPKHGAVNICLTNQRSLVDFHYLLSFLR
jgi:hypothetical protein